MNIRLWSFYYSPNIYIYAFYRNHKMHTTFQEGGYQSICVMGILYKICIYAQWFINVCDVSQSTGFCQGIARVPYFQKSIKNSMLHGIMGMALPMAPTDPYSDLPAVYLQCTVGNCMSQTSLVKLPHGSALFNCGRNQWLECKLYCISFPGVWYFCEDPCDLIKHFEEVLYFGFKT